MKKVLVYLLGILVVGSTFGLQEPDVKFSTYQEMRQHIGKLFQEKKYSEAAEVLEKALEQFPNHLHANAYNLALMRIMDKKTEKALSALNYALEKGVWFGKFDFFQDLWAPLKELAGYKEFTDRNDAELLKAQAKAEPLLEVDTPPGYSRDKKYSLFIALHGGGSNIAAFKPNWTSDKMKNEFVTAYVQSTQVVSMTGFNWTEDVVRARQEILEAYNKVLKEYAVNENEVIIGGFSSGGVAAWEVVLHDTFPVSGLIALCPAKPESFTPERIREAKLRGIRGTLITTEMDQRLPDQKAMDEVMRAQDFPCEFFITPNIGHWFPEDMDKKIDAAIDYIRKK